MQHGFGLGGKPTWMRHWEWPDNLHQKLWKVEQQANFHFKLFFTQPQATRLMAISVGWGAAYKVAALRPNG